ncbi:Alpha/Beta hydrolase protein [Boletus coccyginus]|nr:Alpha/Beta hydrolase protein [Boletus coccyginus]
MSISVPHIPDELQHGVAVVVQTKYGSLKGGRTRNGAAVFLEVPYALPAVRFQDPEPLPEGYRYEDKHYVYETKHCFQPNNNGQGESFPPEDLKGYGNPSEDPFLQFGSPHDLNSQAQYVSQERSEVWVNIGYRLSVLGFLACDEPKVDGNFGFKDQWTGLLWVRDNIASFGGDPDNTQVTGLSAGGHSVHQILHHISRLPAGQNSPIRSARLESNAIMIAPKTAAELRPQFEALCRALELDPKLPNILDILRDPQRVPPQALMHVIETDSVGVYNGTFRGCLDGSWMATDPDPMTWQRSGDLGKKLHEKGVKSVIAGDTIEEWYLYSIAHPINSPADIIPNLLRYYPQSIVDVLIPKYPTLPDNATPEQSQRLFGDILADGQVNIPDRLLARDLRLVDFPVLRYEIHWAPEQLRIGGFATGYEKTLAWLDAVDREVGILERESDLGRPLNQALTLRADQSIGWSEDTRYERFLDIASVLPGEGDN